MRAKDESVQEAIDREASALRASTERLRSERAAIETENAALAALIRKQTKFARQLEQFLDKQ